MIQSFSLEYIEHQLRLWTQAKEIWNRCEISPSDNLTTATFKTYFRNPNGKTTKEILNNLGYRLPSDKLPEGKKIDEKYVSNTIRTEEIDDKELQSSVKWLLDNRSKLSFTDWIQRPLK